MHGPISVADVLKRPVFRDTKVICGISGLQRLVRWVHVLEVSNPRGMIHGGELVLTTGVGLKGRVKLLQDYVAALEAGGAAGLCIELGTAFREIPVGFIEKWRERDFPIVVFPHQVRFVDITQDIHGLLLVQQRQALQEQDQVERVLSGDTAMLQTLGFACDAARRCSVAILSLRDSVPDERLSDWLFRRSDTSTTIRLTFSSGSSTCAVAVRPNEIILLLSLSAQNDWKVNIERDYKRLVEIVSRSGVDASRMRLTVGASVAAPEQIPLSYRQAKYLMTSGHSSRNANGVVFFENLGIYRWLWCMHEHPMFDELIQRDLRKVSEYDRQHHTELVRTLKVYLDCDRSKQETAEKLFIHRQTLYHRLRQLEKLVGAELANPVQRLALHVALYAEGIERQAPE